MNCVAKISSGAAFSSTWWEGFLDRTNAMQEPAIIRDVLTQGEVHDYSASILEILRILCGLRTAMYGFRVYVEGKLQSADEMDVIYDSPPLVSESLKDWVVRVFHGRPFGIIINTGEKFDAALSTSIARKILPLFQIVGMPRDGVNFTIFIGDYDKTPLGIHQDKRGENVMHFHLGPGRKKMYVWDDPKYQSLRKQGLSGRDVNAMKSQAEVYDFGPGDIFFMPEGTWHIGEQSDLSIGLTVWQYTHTNSHVMSNLHRFIFSKVFAKPDAAIQRDTYDVAVSTALDGILQFNPIPPQYAALSYEDTLREAYVDWRHGLKSNAGYRGIPFPKPSGFEVGPNEIIRLCQPYEILLRRRAADSKLNVYARGHIIELNDLDPLYGLIERLNGGAPVAVADLIADTAAVFPPGAVTYLLSEFSRFGAIEAYTQDQAEA